jgi:hypothetical protein
MKNEKKSISFGRAWVVPGITDPKHVQFTASLRKRKVKMEFQKNGGGRNSLFPDLWLKLRPIISVAYPGKKKKTAAAEV